MMRRWPWAVVTLLLAGVVHYLSVLAVPYGVMRIARARIAVAGVNAIVHGDRVTANSRIIVAPSPDLLYSFCPYDLSNGPLRIVSGAPAGTYWSVSIFRNNTDNFYAINDSQAKGAPADLVLYGPNANPPALAEGQIAVQSPSAEGVVIFRTLINDETRLAQIDGERRQAKCTPI
jgi:uncharacterized membrane protein